MVENNKYNLEIKEIPGSRVEITGEISSENFESYRKNSLKTLSADISIPGFRKGHAPENIVLQKIGEPTLLEDMANKALGNALPIIFKENEVDAIGRPEVIITKLASKNPLGFKITVSVLPKITLADYKSIAKEVFQKQEKFSVEDSEVESVIKNLQQNSAQKDGKDINDDKNLSEVTDEFVKTLGDFKDVADFKNKLKEGVRIQKEFKEHDKKRTKALEEIINGSKIDVPDVLIEGELERMMAQFETDIKSAGGTMDDYMKHIKKERADLFKEWRPDADKRAKAQLILNEIARHENIIPSEEDVKKHVDNILKEHKGASKERVIGYVHMVQTNEAVFKFLSEQK